MATYGGDTPVSTEPVDAVGGRIQQHCKPCYKDRKTTPASVYCKNCKEFQCLECSSQHKRYDFMSDHDIVDRQQAETEEHVNMFGYDNCLVHGISVEIYCEDHDVLICAKCAFSNHKKCENAKHIDEFPLEKKIEEFKHRLTACCNKAEEFISNVNEIGIKEKDEAKAKADKMKSDFCDKIDKSLAEFLIEIDSAAKSAKSSMLPQVSGVSNIHDELNMWVNSLNNASKQGLSDKCYILSKSLETKLKENEEYLQYQCLGKSSIHTEHMFKWRGIQQNNDVAVQANGSDILHKDDDGKPKTIGTKIVSLKRKTIYSTGYTNFIGIDFLEDGRLVAVDNRNKKCLILCENLQVLGKPFKFFTPPLGVCAYNEQQVAVTSGAVVYFLKVDRLNNIILTRKVSTSSAYFSISRFNCSMFLCSAYDDDTKVPVRVMDSEGKETDFIDTLFPIAKYTFENSFTTYAEHLGIFILTEFSSNKVYMFNTHTGEIVIVEDKRIQGPRQVCMAPDDTVFVCCDNNSFICRITLNGKVLQAFKVPRLNSSAMSISKDGTKLVLSKGREPEPSIQLYEITYTLNK